MIDHTVFKTENKDHISFVYNGLELLLTILYAPDAKADAGRFESVGFLKHQR
jgi:hypothetical protein